ncbi:MAG: hypothetical protein HC893_08880 [Chloroflexaceae bacterium]|nr:hypothetical protein [Chloroflexaceae bacterium]
MTTVCEVYRQPAEAQHAAESLIAAGIPANTIRILQAVRRVTRTNSVRAASMTTMPT